METTLKIQKEILQKLLTPLSRLNTQKPIIPVLSAVKIETLENKIIAIASDDELSMYNVVETKEEQSQTSFLVELKIILEIIKKLNNDYLFIVVSQNIVTIKQNKSVYKMTQINSFEFPNFDFNMDKTIATDLKTLNVALDKVSYCVSKETYRPMLTGVYIDVDNSYVVATDSYRAAKARVHTSLKENVIFPLKLINELKNHTVEKVYFEIKNNLIYVSLNNFIVISKMIDGKFPDYNNFFIKENEQYDIFTIENSQLIRALERISLFKNDGLPIVKGEFNQDMLVLNSKQLQRGEGIEEIEILDYNGEDNVATFNSEYMLQALKKIDAENVTLLLQHNFKILFSDIDSTHTVVQIKTV